MNVRDQRGDDLGDEVIWVPTDKGRLFAKIWKGNEQREPIILFHDSLGCVELWRDFPKRLSLATGRSVVAYDRLGFGKSDPHPGHLSMNFVRDEADEAFVALRDHLQIKRFAAFGHSVGGGMAVAAAAAFPKHCRALITESAQAFVEDRTIDGIGKASHLFGQADQFEKLKKYHGEKAGWVLEAWVGTWLSPAFMSWNLDSCLPMVQCPALLIHGDRDEYGTTRHLERMSALISGPATTIILTHCGHVPHREKQEVVIDAVTKFLA